eukprot:gb/GECH01009022.1/.p1 GENE.gb/GECH01009022.1/~~gb/GECH01009022.1/.p1  ORF type:complete len:476 (+),score=102.37 gb/GECH01009022.1/:1-1428(+)
MNNGNHQHSVKSNTTQKKNIYTYPPTQSHNKFNNNNNYNNTTNNNNRVNNNGKLTPMQNKHRSQQQMMPPPPEPTQSAFFLPGLTGCRSVENFKMLNKIGEGAFGLVYRGQDKFTGEIVAVKKIKLSTRESEGFPRSALREISILLTLKHPNIVNVKEVVIGNTINSIFLVMEYLENDLRSVMAELHYRFAPDEIKCIMQQLLKAIDYLHDNFVLHRDIKASNILLGNDGYLKLCDFGLARRYEDPCRPYSDNVVTLWYRPPELLLGETQYSTNVDVWGVGCIFGELVRKKVLFTGKTQTQQLDQIFRVLGTPDEKIWPGYDQLPHTQRFEFNHYPESQLRKMFPQKPKSAEKDVYLSEKGFDLLSKMLTYNPKERISAKEALEHPYFKEHPFPRDRKMMPRFKATNEVGHSRKRKSSEVSRHHNQRRNPSSSSSASTSSTHNTTQHSRERRNLSTFMGSGNDKPEEPKRKIPRV